MDATHATTPSASSSTPSLSSSTLQLLTSTPPSSEQLCSSSSKQLCGSTRLVLAELGLGRLSKFAHALDLSKLRAGAISAPELRALGLSTHEIQAQGAEYRVCQVFMAIAVLPLLGDVDSQL